MARQSVTLAPSYNAGTANYACDDGLAVTLVTLRLVNDSYLCQQAAAKGELQPQGLQGGSARLLPHQSSLPSHLHASLVLKQ